MPNILIVEASSDLLELYQVIFKNDDLNVIGCHCIDSLFECLQNTIPDLMIFDIVPAGITMEFIQNDLKDRLELKDIPTIVTSTNASFIDGYEQYGIDAAIEKPFDVSILLSKVKNLLSPHYV